MKLELIIFRKILFLFILISGTSLFANDFQPPNLDDEAYKVENSFYPESGNQCTWYAFGRTKERQNIKLEFKPDIPRDAQLWGDLLSTDYPRSDKPRSGAIAIWQHKHIEDFGHVAYVEYIYGDVILYTEANFSNYKEGGGYEDNLKHQKIKDFEGNKGGERKYRFIGYVYPTQLPLSSKILEIAHSSIADNQIFQGSMQEGRSTSKWRKSAKIKIKIKGVENQRGRIRIKGVESNQRGNQRGRNQRGRNQ